MPTSSAGSGQPFRRPIDTEPMPPSPFFASIGLAGSSRIGYMLIQVPEDNTVKNRVNLDLDADDVSVEVARVNSAQRNTHSRQGRVRHALDDPGRPRRQRVLHRHPAPLTVSRGNRQRCRNADGQISRQTTRYRRPESTLATD